MHILFTIQVQLAIDPLSSNAQLKLPGPQKVVLPRVILEDPIAIRAIFPGFYNHAERRVPLRSNNPQDVSLATPVFAKVTSNNNSPNNLQNDL